MPAPPLYNTFEGGVDDATIVTGSGVGASGNEWNVVTSTPQYDNVHPAIGSMGMKTVDPAAAMNVRWQTLGNITTSVYARFYLWIPNAPTGTFFRPFGFLDSGGATRAAFEIQTSGIARVHSGAATAAGALTFPTAAIVRVEVRGLAAAGTGEVEARWWSTPSSTGAPTETILLQNQNNGTSLDQAFFGSANTFPTAPYTTWIDDVAVGAGGWVGPVAPKYTNTVVPTVTGGLTVGGTLTANPGTWTAYGAATPTVFNYYWHRMDDAAGTNLVEIGATGATYTLSSSDLNKYLRAGVIPVS